MRSALRLISVLTFCFTSLFNLLPSCMLDTFKNFSILSVSVPENGVIGTELQKIEIIFSKDIYEEGADEFVRIESSSGEISVHVEVSDNSLIVYPEERWSPYERYWLIVSRHIKDTFGKELGVDFYHPFQSTEGLIPVSAALVYPEIVNGIVESEISEISIIFQSDVDKNSVEREFFLLPAAAGYFEWTSDRAFRYHLLENLQKNCLYTINISENAKDNYGYDIKSFKREFEYCPNQEYPEIQMIFIDGIDIFDSGNYNSYILEEGVFVVQYYEAEKDLALRIDFSSAIDKSTFSSNFQVTPFVSWYDEWISDNTVVITFKDDLLLNELYEININKGIEDESRIGLQYKYLIILHINGENSKFIQFYADDFQLLDISAILSNASGIISPENYTLSKNTDYEGSFIEIEYYNSTEPEDIDIELIISLRFTHPHYIPALNTASAQDSCEFYHVFGEGGIIAGIADFNWNTGSMNECRIHIPGVKTDNIYCFSIQGGKNGIIDELNNYLEDDIEFYFKVKLIQED